MENILNRRDGESNYEYCFRLSWEKHINKVDIDWKEIADLSEMSWSADHCRKTMIGAIERQKYIDGKTKEQLYDEQYEKLIQKESQIKREKIKLQDEKTYNNALLRNIARIEDIVELLKEEIVKLNNSKPLISSELNINKLPSGYDGCAFISDMHIGAEVDNILDCYNPQIAKEKLNYYIDKVIDYGKFNNIDKLYFLNGGDIVSGLIHNVNRYDSRMNMVQQITFASELLSEAINKLSQHFVVVTGIVFGNHDRIVANKDNSVNNDSFVVLIKDMIKLRLQNNKNVYFIDDKGDSEILSFKIKGHNCCLVHGDSDGDKQLHRLIEMFDDKIDFIFRGHYHNNKQFEFNRTTVISSGSFSQEDYAKKARLYSKPIMPFLLFSEDGLECNYNINLSLYNK